MTNEDERLEQQVRSAAHAERVEQRAAAVTVYEVPSERRGVKALRATVIVKHGVAVCTIVNVTRWEESLGMPNGVAT